MVEQRQEEGTAQELLTQIKVEKKKLPKEKKIKKEKLLPEITESEIPKSWEWVRLGELCKRITSIVFSDSQAYNEKQKMCEG